MTDAPTAADALPFAPQIDLPEDDRRGLVGLLNQALAETTDLYLLTKQAHWNVKGENFYQVHELYDHVSGELPEYADRLAERAVLLGGYARGSARMTVAASRLDPFPGYRDDDRSFLRAMTQRWATYAEAIREASRQADSEYDDPGTSDLFDAITHLADRGRWMIEAQLQRYDGGLPDDGADPA